MTFLPTPVLSLAKNKKSITNYNNPSQSSVHSTMPENGFKSGVSALLQRKAGSLSCSPIGINQMINIKFALSQETKKIRQLFM